MRGPAIEVTRFGVVARATARQRAAAKARFAREHLFVLERFIDRDLLELLQAQIERGRFTRSRLRIGKDRSLEGCPAVRALQLLLNDHVLLDFVEDMAGCGRLGCILGGVRRAMPGPGNTLGWHNDVTFARKVAITINLSNGRYQGGLLQIRDARRKTLIREFANTGPGDAVLFRVSPSLEHRNTEVVGAVAKTAYSGWFMRTPRFEAGLEAKFFAPPAPPALESIGKPRRTRALAPGGRVAFATTMASWRVGDDVILVDMTSGASLRLDVIGARMCDLLRSGNSPRRAATAIAKEFDAAAADVEGDVLRLGHMLRAAGLLV